MPTLFTKDGFIVLLREFLALPKAISKQSNDCVRLLEGARMCIIAAACKGRKIEDNDTVFLELGTIGLGLRIDIAEPHLPPKRLHRSRRSRSSRRTRRFRSGR